MLLPSLLALLLSSTSLCSGQPVDSQEPSATVASKEDFVENAIIPTASGQIGINPVDVPLQKDYTASIGVDTDYLTELVQDDKTSTDWVGTATDFGLATYTTTGYDGEPTEQYMPRGFRVASADNGKIEITLSKRMKDELNEINELVPKCDDEDKDCLLQRPPQFLSELSKRAVPVRAAHVLARDIGEVSGIDVFSLVAGGGLLAFGASEVIGTAAAEAIAAVGLLVAEVGLLAAAGAVAVGAIAVLAVLWGLGGFFSEQWKLKTDVLTPDHPNKEEEKDCPELALACVGNLCQGGPGNLCTQKWPGCTCDPSSSTYDDIFFWAWAWYEVEEAVEDFVVGKEVESSAECSSSDSSTETVTVEEDTWSEVLDKFCETKPTLASSFDEQWNPSELGVDGFEDGWKFEFELEANEDNACKGYICEDVLGKFKSCSHDSQSVLDRGKLSLDCGTVQYQIYDKKPADPNEVGRVWRDDGCWTPDQFGSHKDIWEDKVYEFAGQVCSDAKGHQIKQSDPSTAISVQKNHRGAPYQFNIYWKDQCKLDDGYTYQDGFDPMNDGEEAREDLCLTLLFKPYKDCFNGGTGGTSTLGCLVYEFKAAEAD